MNEGQFQSKVLTWLRKNDVFVIKYNASGISEAGVPDVIMNLQGYFVAVELKQESGLPGGWHFLGTLPLCAEVLAGLCHSQLTVSRFS